MRVIITSLLTFLCIFINGFTQTEKEIKKIFLEAESYQQFKKLLDVQEYYQIDYVDLQIKACEIAEKLKEEPIKYRERKLNNEINSYQLNFNPIVSASMHCGST